MTPRNETYVFIVTAVSYNNNRLSVDVFHDGVSKVRTYSTNSGYQQTVTLGCLPSWTRGTLCGSSVTQEKIISPESMPITTFSGFILRDLTLLSPILIFLFQKIACNGCQKPKCKISKRAPDLF